MSKHIKNLGGDTRHPTPRREKPKLIECGDQSVTGGWWTECGYCREETFSADCWDTCGKCGARWWEGEFVDFNG